MNAFPYSHVLPPLVLGLADLFFAGLLHRAIVRNAALLRRRHFFEFFAVLAFLIALLLLATGFGLWRENPRFVLVCSATWALGCTVGAYLLGRRGGARANDELSLPEPWPLLPQDVDDIARLSGRSRSSSRADGTVAPPARLDAFTRARLKRARRLRSVDGGRSLVNRSAYDDKIATLPGGSDERH